MIFTQMVAQSSSPSGIGYVMPNSYKAITIIALAQIQVFLTKVVDNIQVFSSPCLALVFRRNYTNLK